MKKYLLLTLFFAFALRSSSQVYTPFPDSNASWCCSTSFTDGMFIWFTNSQYTLNGFTQINNFNYDVLQLYAVEDAYHLPDWTWAGTSSGTTTYYIRQDTSLRIVWIYDNFTSGDTILYNFNLHIGDTLNRSKVFWNTVWPPSPYLVTSIDSVLINGSYRRRFNYGQDSASFQGCQPTTSSDSSMIEGIGCLHGLMYAPSCYEQQAALEEFIRDGVVEYGDSSSVQNYCTAIAGTFENLHPANLFLISPNPATNSISITSPYFIHSVTIYNVLGEKVAVAAVQSAIKNPQSEMSVDVRALPPSIYFLQVQTENGTVVQKLVKE